MLVNDKNYEYCMKIRLVVKLHRFNYGMFLKRVIKI